MAKRVYIGDIELMTSESVTQPQVVQTIDPAYSRFSGKTLFVTGDSITENNFQCAIPVGVTISDGTIINGRINWHGYLWNWLNLGAVINNGVSSIGWTRDAGNCLLEKMSSWTGTPDYILAFASMNDMGGNNESMTVGTFADTTLRSSYYADCKAFIAALITKYPSVPIGIISPPPRLTIRTTETGYGKDSPYYDWNIALRTVCEHYCVPFFDMFQQSGLKPYNASNRGAYYNDSIGVHPNYLGQRVMAQKIFGFVRQYL